MCRVVGQQLLGALLLKRLNNPAGLVLRCDRQSVAQTTRQSAVSQRWALTLSLWRNGHPLSARTIRCPWWDASLPAA